AALRRAAAAWRRLDLGPPAGTGAPPGRVGAERASRGQAVYAVSGSDFALAGALYAALRGSPFHLLDDPLAAPGAARAGGQGTITLAADPADLTVHLFLELHRFMMEEGGLYGRTFGIVTGYTLAECLRLVARLAEAAPPWPTTYLLLRDTDRGVPCSDPGVVITTRQDTLTARVRELSDRGIGILSMIINGVNTYLYLSDGRLCCGLPRSERHPVPRLEIPDLRANHVFLNTCSSVLFDQWDGRREANAVHSFLAGHARSVVAGYRVKLAVAGEAALYASLCRAGLPLGQVARLLNVNYRHMPYDWPIYMLLGDPEERAAGREGCGGEPEEHGGSREAHGGRGFEEGEPLPGSPYGRRFKPAAGHFVQCRLPLPAPPPGAGGAPGPEAAGPRVFVRCLDARPHPRDLYYTAAPGGRGAAEVLLYSWEPLAFERLDLEASWEPAVSAAAVRWLERCVANIRRLYLYRLWNSQVKGRALNLDNHLQGLNRILAESRYDALAHSRARRKFEQARQYIREISEFACRILVDRGEHALVGSYGEHADVVAAWVGGLGGGSDGPEGVRCPYCGLPAFVKRFAFPVEPGADRYLATCSRHLLLLDRPAQGREFSYNPAVRVFRRGERRVGCRISFRNELDVPASGHAFIRVRKVDNVLDNPLWREFVITPATLAFDVGPGEEGRWDLTVEVPAPRRSEAGGVPAEARSFLLNAYVLSNLDVFWVQAPIVLAELEEE
ncbi:MAG: hypothetical protein K6T75_04295, partial [Acetobacteraceae bacterium]|nr:hypothetical protein [Acetobacteraceae bacterium]